MEYAASLRILGERIRLARKAAGFSQEQLALEAGIDRSFMGQVERGQRNVSFSTLWKVARVLRADLGSFFAGLAESDVLTPIPGTAGVADIPEDPSYTPRSKPGHRRRPKSID